MQRNARSMGRLLVSLCLAFANAFTGAALAQSNVTPEQEYQQLIKVNQDIAP